MLGIGAICPKRELKFMRLSFARTYASVQGTEFDDTLRLHDVANRHFTMRHLFVALSRARDKGKIDIA